MMYKKDKKRKGLTKEWIVAFITSNGANTKIPHIVKVLKHLQGPKKDGSLERQISDGSVFVKATFTSNSTAKFYQDQDESSPPEWDRAILLLKQYQLNFDPHHQQDQCEFSILVEEFMLWSAHHAFDRKNKIQNCMDDPKVQSCASAAWNAWREKGRKDTGPDMSMNSVLSLSQLLEEMANQSGAVAESSLHRGETEPSTSILPESRIAAFIESSFCVEDCIIPDHEMAILNSIEEWKDNYRPLPPTQSTESTSQSPAELFPGPTLVDVPRCVRHSSIPGAAEKIVITVDVHRLDETSDPESGANTQQSSIWTQGDDEESIHFTCSMSPDPSPTVTTGSSSAANNATNAVVMKEVVTDDVCWRKDHSGVSRAATDSDTSSRTPTKAKDSQLQSDPKFKQCVISSFEDSLVLSSTESESRVKNSVSDTYDVIDLTTDSQPDSQNSQNVGLTIDSCQVSKSVHVTTISQPSKTVNLITNSQPCKNVSLTTLSRPVDLTVETHPSQSHVPRDTQPFEPQFTEPSTEPFVPQFSESHESQSTHPFVPQFSETSEMQGTNPFTPHVDWSDCGLIPASEKANTTQTSHPFAQYCVSQNMDSENSSSLEICSLSLLSNKHKRTASCESTQKEDNHVRPNFQLSPIKSLNGCGEDESFIAKKRSRRGVDSDLEVLSDDVAIVTESIVEADREENRRLSLLAATDNVMSSGSHSVVAESDNLQSRNNCGNVLEACRQVKSGNTTLTQQQKKRFKILKRKWGDLNDKATEEDLSDHECQRNINIVAYNLDNFQLNKDTIKRKRQQSASALHSVTKTKEPSKNVRSKTGKNSSILSQKAQNTREIEKDCESPDTSRQRQKARIAEALQKSIEVAMTYRSVKPVISHEDYLAKLARQRRMKSFQSQQQRLRGCLDDDLSRSDSQDNIRSQNSVEKIVLSQVVPEIDITCTESNLSQFRLSQSSLMKIKKLFKKTDT
ncbi:uncharacterized protein LOC121388633 [Gigantopelta aegis]|uniref:uncharacterized protein LOC121388633 n=1 Tax=Gigantopelta aegis TaxID=1735272 RepID=UPI001B88D710|nr:uncharacterized protein LOC121388633 [Gigantopelta aegis]